MGEHARHGEKSMDNLILLDRLLQGEPLQAVSARHGERLFLLREPRRPLDRRRLLRPAVLPEALSRRQPVDAAKIDEAEAIFAKHFGSAAFFNRAGWEHIVRSTAAGYRCGSSRAEGSVVPNRNVLMTIENTDPRLLLADQLAGNAARAGLVRLHRGHAEPGDEEDPAPLSGGDGRSGLADFKLHDFGFRGVSSVETAGVGGAAHLVNFRGTDTMAGLVLARDYYGCEMAGFSIPAGRALDDHLVGPRPRSSTPTEHARPVSARARSPSSATATTSSVPAANSGAAELRDKVLHRDGTLVIRPDTGDPTEVCPRVLDILGERFGPRRTPRATRCSTRTCASSRGTASTSTR